MTAMLNGTGWTTKKSQSSFHRLIPTLSSQSPKRIQILTIPWSRDPQQPAREVLSNAWVRDGGANSWNCSAPIHGLWRSFLNNWSSASTNLCVLYLTSLTAPPLGLRGRPIATPRFASLLFERMLKSAANPLFHPVSECRWRPRTSHPRNFFPCYRVAHRDGHHKSNLIYCVLPRRVPCSLLFVAGSTTSTRGRHLSYLLSVKSAGTTCFRQHGFPRRFSNPLWCPMVNLSMCWTTSVSN